MMMMMMMMMLKNMSKITPNEKKSNKTENKVTVKPGTQRGRERQTMSFLFMNHGSTLSM